MYKLNISNNRIFEKNVMCLSCDISKLIKPEKLIDCSMATLLLST